MSEIKDAQRLKNEITVRLQHEGRHTGEPSDAIGMLTVAVVAKGEAMSARKNMTADWFSSLPAARDRSLGLVQETAKNSNNPLAEYFEGFIADARQMPMLPVRHGWCRLIDGQILDFSDIEKAYRVYFGIVVDKSLIGDSYNKESSFLLDEISIKAYFNDFNETFKEIIDEGKEESLNFFKTKFLNKSLP